MITRVATIVFLVGILSLVGYLLFTTHLSGEKVGRFTVQEFEGKIVSFVGFQMTQGKTVSHTGGPIELSPEMNPLRMIVHLKTIENRSVGLDRLNYEFRLVDESGAVVWQQNGQRQSSSDSSNKTSRVDIPLEAFHVERTGQYMLLSNLTEASVNHPIVARVDLTIKRNVARSNPLVSIGLGLLSGVGFVTMLATRRRA